MLRRPCISCLWLLTLCAAALHAEQLAVRVLTTEDGLARKINQIRRDSKGYLWFCTREGLSLFDGRQFINYSVADGLPHSVVSDLIETRRGGLLTRMK